MSRGGCFLLLPLAACVGASVDGSGGSPGSETTVIDGTADRGDDPREDSDRSDDDRDRYGDGDGDADDDREDEREGDADTDADTDADDPDCDARVCDPYEQCGCEAGEGCAWDEDQEPACGVAGPAEQDDRCEEEACAAGLVCVGDYLDRYTCLGICDDAHPCPGGQDCVVELVGADGRTFTSVCATTCDLLADDCREGHGCAFFGDATVCVLSGPTPAGGTCMSVEECQAGSSCVLFEGEQEAHCLAHCDPSGARPCPGGQECFSNPGDEAGVCATP